ncbi:MAG: phosphatase PAP2 family protein [Candidatus Baltobacteraceae bacterium]
MSPQLRSRLGPLVVALLAFGLFIALGVHVVYRGEPVMLAAWEHELVGHSTLVAWWLTWTCYLYALLPVAIVLLILAWRLPAWRARILFSVAMLLLCWQGADLAQHLFMRPRRLDWIVKHEHAFSYPSSHAAIATGFYGLWAVMLYTSELPKVTRRLAGVLLALLALAICWSRLALGAHYVTDLVGGALLAVALLSVALAIVPVNLFGPVAGRLSGAAK